MEPRTREPTPPDHHTAQKTVRGAVVHDRLAMDLTLLSNERTLLAYVRTALAFLAAGAALIARLAGGGAWVDAGWVLVGIGILTGIFGALRYFQTRRELNRWWRPDGEE